MKRSIQVLLLAASALSASARPYLQLHKVSEGDGQTVSLCAVVDALAPGANGTFYIAAAIVPAPSDAPLELGAFRFDGMPVRATNDMIYGTPANQKRGKTYPTWYREFSFNFNRSQRTVLYDAEAAGAPARPEYHSGGDALYREFTVDVSGLPPGTTLAFELYSHPIKQRKLTFANVFKRPDMVFPPGLNPSGRPPVSVPDSSGTLLMSLAALTGLVLVGRRVRR